jgi:hypothetical protein
MILAGFYNVLAWMSINMLLGNFDAKGGMIKPTAYDISGKGKWFDLKAHPGNALLNWSFPVMRGLYARHGKEASADRDFFLQRCISAPPTQII